MSGLDTKPVRKKSQRDIMATKKAKMAYDMRRDLGIPWSDVARSLGFSQETDVCRAARKYAFYNDLPWPLSHISRSDKAENTPDQPKAWTHSKDGYCGSLTIEEVIERYRTGEHVSDIARAAGVSTATVYNHMRKNGCGRGSNVRNRESYMKRFIRHVREMFKGSSFDLQIEVKKRKRATRSRARQKTAYEEYEKGILSWDEVARKLGYTHPKSAYDGAYAYAVRENLPWPLRNGVIGKHGE